MDKKIVYLNFYSSDFDDDYIPYPSGWPKIDYIVSILQQEHKIEMLAPLEKKTTGFRWFRYKRTKAGNKLVHVPTFRIGKFFGLDTFFRQFFLLLYLLKNVSKNDILLIYHSMFFVGVVNFFLKIKKVSAVLQVEELYYTLNKKNHLFENREVDYVKSFTKLVLVNDLLKERFNNASNECIVAYGDYSKIEYQRNINSNNKINILYAGTIEFARKAAFIAAETINYLPENYCINIAGFGSDQDISRFLRLVNEINSKSNEKRINYLGFLQGSAYKKILLQSDIGLSCHSYTKEELVSADNTFPSKLIIYLKHNLAVVCNDIKCVRNSALADDVSFFGNSEPSEIADAILKIKFRANGRETIEKLD